MTEPHDDYHTLSELYQHRNMLFLALMNIRFYSSWISKLHHDGTGEPGWFIAGMETPAGSISYHMPIDLWDLAVKTHAKVLDRGKPYDGHTSMDVLQRLSRWINPYEH